MAPGRNLICEVETIADSNGQYHHYCPVCMQSLTTSTPTVTMACRGPKPVTAPPRDCPVISTQEPDGRWRHWCPQCNRGITTNRPNLRQVCFSPARGACRFLAEPNGEVPCSTCGGQVMVPTFGCHLHGICTSERAVAGTAFCGRCVDHKPLGEATETTPRYTVLDPPDLFLLGYPGDVGGASTEAWHTIKLWRSENLRVVAIPTWGRSGQWELKVEATGTITLPVHASNLSRAPGLAGATVVSFCNDQFLKYAPQLKALDCKLVWANCMTWLFEAEKELYEHQGVFDAYLFQSQYQLDTLGPQLAEYGAGDDQFHLIHGAFDPSEFPFRPTTRRGGDPFIVGKLARPDLDKWPARLWQVYGAIGGNVQAEVMGWSDALSTKCGTPPAWATARPAMTVSPLEFLRKLHVLIPLNGDARENWPRVGLEAMSTGVPIIAPNRWGWREMVKHGQTGFLADNETELISYAQILQHNEPLRLEMAIKGRKRLERELANPTQLGAQWRALLESLKPQGSVQDAGA